MGILSGIVSFLLGLAVNLMDVAVNSLLAVFEIDMSVFFEYFPAAKDFQEIIIGLALGLLFIFFVFQVFRNFGIVAGLEAEDPLQMLGKCVIFLGMIVCSASITDIITGLLRDPYRIFMGAWEPGEMTFPVVDMMSSMLETLTMPFVPILYILALLILGWQFLKLLIEVMERYLVFCGVLYFAPIVYATGPSKSTSQIFKSWCRMVGSQALLLLINIWSLKLFLSYLMVFSEQSGAGEIAMYFLVGYAFLKFAQKIDTYLRIIGLNTASTGDVVRSIGGTVAGIALSLRTAAGMASKLGGGKASGRKSSSGEAGGTGGQSASPMGTPGDGKPGMGSAPGESQEPAVSAAERRTQQAKQQYISSVLNSAMQQKDAATGEQPVPSIDPETREGLSNLAHGLPHTEHNGRHKGYKGGGFPEFTGEKANLIGASQLTPADGFGQEPVRMPDGSHGTKYTNPDTGESHLVQFGSVDNGVVQGTIAGIDPKTGKPGDDMAFKAVHSSVPGAESFSGHAVPIRDSEGGTYHLATGASTSFLASGAVSPVGSGPRSSSGGTVAGAPVSGTVSKMADTVRGSASDFSAGTHAVSMADSPSASGMSSGSGVQVADMPSGAQAHRSTLDTAAAGPSPAGQESTPVPISRSADTGQPPSNIRRFSRNNPANVEVFRRQGAGKEVERFAKTQTDSDVVSGINHAEKE